MFDAFNTTSGNLKSMWIYFFPCTRNVEWRWRWSSILLFRIVSSKPHSKLPGYWPVSIFLSTFLNIVFLISANWYGGFSFDAGRIDIFDKRYERLRRSFKNPFQRHGTLKFLLEILYFNIYAFYITIRCWKKQFTFLTSKDHNFL